MATPNRAHAGLLRTAGLALLIAFGLALTACGRDAAAVPADDSASKPAPSKPAPEKPKADEPVAKDDAPKGEVVLDDHGHPKGLHRYIRWSEKIGQGAQPEGEIAFQNLQALGYKTVLTVDGAMPPVELAKRYGLRYVHVPIGYDGINRDAALRIAKAASSLETPIYVHCHHGKHRGPAAAMIARMQVDGVSNAECELGLEKSGTSHNYSGLYRDIAAFLTFDDEALATIDAQDLPALVRPEGVRASMVQVSARFENLKLCKEAAWKPLADHPDVSAAHEARMLWELYRESARTPDGKAHGAAYLRMLGEGEKIVIGLEKAIRAGDSDAADRSYEVMVKNCKACHKATRN
jgi:hypothetical protein